MKKIIPPLLKKLSTWTVLILFLFMGVFVGLLHYKIEQKVNNETQMLITIKSGTSFNRFSKQLVSLGVIDNRFWLRNYTRLYPEYAKIKAGTYQVQSSYTLEQLLATVINGKEHQYQITFIEGSTLSDWLKILQQHPEIKQTITFDSIEQAYALVSKKLKLKQRHPEGLFFPDTYAFTQGTTDLDILARANKVMSTLIEATWQQRQQGLPIENAYQALILASIIEKESAKISEYPIISSVFINRLNDNMRLQTDPTVIYGLGERFKGDIKRSHLREKTAYNTYRIDGLPPTPIAMPSKLALQAAVNPDVTDYYYFVSNGQGEHVFSTTLKAHNQAVKRYQLSQK